jgi:5-methylcytosine-specific restriction endonuclease McrA
VIVAIELKKLRKADRWSIIRLSVLARDRYTCQDCALVIRRRAHVHHIIKRVLGGSDDQTNLVTLCGTCHGRRHHPKLVVSAA